MMANQKGMQLEMAMKQRQAQMAMGMAIGKERFTYYSVFVGLLYTTLPIAAIKSHNPMLLGPLFPLTIAWLW